MEARSKLLESRVVEQQKVSEEKPQQGDQFEFLEKDLNERTHDLDERQAHLGKTTSRSRQDGNSRKKNSR